MFRRALLKALSLEHGISHHPHNPHCDICIRAHLKQSRVHRSTPAEDDQLLATAGVGQRLSADHIIVVREANSDDQRAGAEGEIFAFTVRDRYSGMALVFPQRRKTKDESYKVLKFFQGPSGRYRPNIVVKSDCAGEITGVVSDLGWHPEPALENRFPHNAEPER